MSGALREVLIWSVGLRGVVLGACQCADITRIALGIGLVREFISRPVRESWWEAGWSVVRDVCRLAYVDVQGIGTWYLYSCMPNVENPELSSSLLYEVRIYTYQYCQ